MLCFRDRASLSSVIVESMSELPRKMGFSQELSEYLHRMETVTVAVDVVKTIGVTVMVALRTPVVTRRVGQTED